MKLLPTKKLYYNKYPYRIEFNVPQAGCLGHDRYEFTFSLIAKHSKGSNVRQSTYPGTAVNAALNPKFRKFALVLERYIRQQKELDLKIRTEGNSFNLFSKDEQLVDYLIGKLPEYVDTVSKPEDIRSLEYLLNNNRKVLVRALPHGKYRYKITLRDTMSSLEKEKFYKWLDRSKYHVSNTTIRYLSGKTWYAQNPFFYAETQGDTSMAALFLGTNIRHIQEYILNDTLEAA
jgi:hypothetical protein